MTSNHILWVDELICQGWVTSICINKLNHHWFRWWLGAEQAPSHYLNQCWLIVNWPLRNTFQSNINQNKAIQNITSLIQEKEFEKVLCKMMTIWSWRQRVKTPWRSLMPAHPLGHAVRINLTGPPPVSKWTGSWVWRAPCCQDMLC